MPRSGEIPPAPRRQLYIVDSLHTRHNAIADAHNQTISSNIRRRVNRLKYLWGKAQEDTNENEENNNNNNETSPLPNGVVSSPTAPRRRSTLPMHYYSPQSIDTTRQSSGQYGDMAEEDEFIRMHQSDLRLLGRKAGAAPTPKEENENQNNNNNNNNGNAIDFPSSFNNNNNNHSTLSERKRKKLQKKQDSRKKTKDERYFLEKYNCVFREPVELQVESLTKFILRSTLYVFYLGIIAALVLQILPVAQWEVNNICSAGNKRERMNLRHVERWTSPCLTVDDTDPDNHKIILSGSGVSFINGDLYRFRRFIISLPFPAAQVNEREEYLLFTSFQTVVEGVPSSTLTYPTRLVCDRSSYTYKRNDKSRKRCNLIRLPEEFLNNQRTDRVAVVTVTISGVPAEISNAVKTMREDDLPSVGLAYQKSAYTLAALIIRYIFLFFSLCHTVRFIVHSKHTSMLYEQRMIVTLQIFLFWYLNPLAVLDIVSRPMPTVLAFLEFRVPVFFFAVLIAFMFSVLTASMVWRQLSDLIESYEKDPTKKEPSAIVKLFHLLTHSVSLYEPPPWTKMLAAVYVLVIFVLEVIDASLDHSDWYGAANTFLSFPNLSRENRGNKNITNNAHHGILHWVVIALLALGGFVNVLLLFYLRSYLGKKSYLETRPQQLACRVFQMVFFVFVLYYVYHLLVFYIYYNQDHPVTDSRYVFIQIPALLVAALFVNVLTLVYTTRSRETSSSWGMHKVKQITNKDKKSGKKEKVESEDTSMSIVPIIASDPRWKVMVWPDSYYRWLYRHGGSQYLFASEEEEINFYRIQYEFRVRKILAKRKRERRAASNQKKKEEKKKNKKGGKNNNNENENSVLHSLSREVSSFFSRDNTNNNNHNNTNRAPQEGNQLEDTHQGQHSPADYVTPETSGENSHNKDPQNTENNHANPPALRGFTATQTSAAPADDQETSISVSNMDKYSTYYLPAAPVKGRSDIRIRDATTSQKEDGSVLLSLHNSFVTEPQVRIPPREAGLGLHAHVGSTYLSPHASPARRTTRPKQEEEQISVHPKTNHNSSASSSSSSSSDSSSDEELGKSNTGLLFRAVTRAREAVGTAMGTAEHVLLERPVRRFNQVENYLFDRVMLIGDTANHNSNNNIGNYLPFFNLETAMDCYNMSWEVYNLYGEELKAEQDGIRQVLVQEERARRELERLNHNVSKDNGSSNGNHELQKTPSGATSKKRFSLATPRRRRDTLQAPKRASAVSPTGVSSVPASVKNNEEDNENENNNNTEDERQLFSTPNHDGDEQKKRESFALEDTTRQNNEDTPSNQNNNEEEDDDEEGITITTEEVENRRRQDPAALPPMNVEKYGYTLLNVVTIDAVQLIIVKMDTEAPEHKGKAPRIIFSFRGTANLTNAKYDLNIHRVVWREMARAARQEKKRENKPENEEDSEEELNEHEKKKKKNKKKEEARQEDAEEDAELQEVLSMATGRELNDSISSAATLASQLLAGEHNNNNNNNGIHEPGAGGSALLGCRSCLQSCVDRTSFQPAVHAGFLALWKSFRPYVMKELKKLATRDSDDHNSANTNHNNHHNVYRFFTTGHSLGAALASLCAYSMTLYLERVKYPLSEVTVYSYGQPRMGNKVFCGLYNKKVPRSFRVFNESDIVVTMTMFGSYHIGLEVNIDRHGNYIIKPTEIEKMFPPTKGRGLAVLNHLMANYGASMNAIADKVKNCPARALQPYANASAEVWAAHKKEEKMLEDNRVKVLSSTETDNPNHNKQKEKEKSHHQLA